MSVSIEVRNTHKLFGTNKVLNRNKSCFDFTSRRFVLLILKNKNHTNAIKLALGKYKFKKEKPSTLEQMIKYQKIEATIQLQKKKKEGKN